MTRVTKMKRKTYEEATGFYVKPLKPTATSNSTNSDKKEETITKQSPTPAPSSPIEVTNDSNHHENSNQQQSKKKRRFKKPDSSMAESRESIEHPKKQNDHQEESYANPNQRNQHKKQQQEQQNDGQSKRALRRKIQKMKKMQCFACRKFGHSVSDCPLDKEKETICYKCGKGGHSVSQCRVKVDPLNPYPFAKCFVCQEMGHLSGACEKNANGLYPNGGGCKYCGDKTHLAKDCKPVQQGKDTGNIKLGTIDLEQGADDDDVYVALHKMNQDKQNTMPPKPKKKKVISF